MGNIADTPQAVIKAIQELAQKLGRVPSKSEFESQSGMSERQVNKHFDGWNAAVKAAGYEPNSRNAGIADGAILEDWGHIVRKLRGIPTAVRYEREGNYSEKVFRRFGPWSKLPDVFRNFAREKPEWNDVITLLPPVPGLSQPASTAPVAEQDNGVRDLRAAATARHSKLTDRPTYGNPIDFRGLRHEPINEQGVVFLFGVIAKELGYMVEAVQTGFPDCEAKRQLGPDSWQRVRIEFEFESRNFRDHRHNCDGCDLIVCWRHNWQDCPRNLEVVELASVIKTLSNGED